MSKKEIFGRLAIPLIILPAGYYLIDPNNLESIIYYLMLSFGLVCLMWHFEERIELVNNPDIKNELDRVLNKNGKK